MPIQIDVVKDALDTIQAITTIVQVILSSVAIIVGGWWVYRNVVLKRERMPRAAITHDVTANKLTDRKTFVHVVVAITNTGDVLLRLKNCLIIVQQVLPLLPEVASIIQDDKNLIEEITRYMPEEARATWSTEVPWPKVDRHYLEWNKGEKEIEPGNMAQLRFDFVLDSEIEVIRIYTFFENVVRPRLVRHRWVFWRRKKIPVGWDFASLHEIATRTPPDPADMKPARRKFRIHIVNPWSTNSR